MAGASLTPSAGHSDNFMLAFKALTMRILCSGETRRKHVDVFDVARRVPRRPSCPAPRRDRLYGRERARPMLSAMALAVLG